MPVSMSVTFLRSFCTGIFPFGSRKSMSVGYMQYLVTEELLHFHIQRDFTNLSAHPILAVIPVVAQGNDFLGHAVLQLAENVAVAQA
jgi:hypothetical protein